MTTAEQAPLDPRTTALIVVNPAQAYVDDIHSVAAFAHVAKVLDIARERGVTVVFSALVHAEDGSDLGRFEGEPVRPEKFIAASSKTPENDPIVAAVTPREGELVIDRNRYSAFFETDLDDRLRERGIETIVLGGNSTNHCAESTARDANFRDYHVIVLTDGTTPVPLEIGGRLLSVEETQQFALAQLRRGFALTLTSDAVIAALGPAKVASST